MSGLLAARSRSAAAAASAVRRSISSGCLRSSSSNEQDDDSGWVTTGGWTDETPKGAGAAELWVYRPESGTRWPDRAMGVLASEDPRFALPGHVGVVAVQGEKAETVTDPEEEAAAKASLPDVLSRPTNIENQVRAVI